MAISDSPSHYPFSRSRPVEEHLFRTSEYFCKFAPRIHKDARLADQGSWQCQVDFLNASGPSHLDCEASSKSYAVGCINPVVGNFTALCACEALPERLALTTYMVEYAYIHDDVVEYAKDKTLSGLLETNRELVEGLDLDNAPTVGTQRAARHRQLQAKMVVELLDADRAQGLECLRLWKEMSDVFVQIRDLNFATMEEYLPFRVVDAGCPWTMSLLCFSMDFYLTEAEQKDLSTITDAAYSAWVLVNDYFSWEKEILNHQANDSEGQIVSAVFLFMKWHATSAAEAKKLLRAEIQSREEIYCDLKSEYLRRGKVSDKARHWFDLLDLVTAGNFAWSMTTSRYDHNAPDAYTALRANHRSEDAAHSRNCLDLPISARVATQHANGQHDDAPGIAHTNGSLTESQMVDSPMEHGRKPCLESAESRLSAFEEVVLEPCNYIASMPSKGVRGSAIDALDIWYEVPDESRQIIREIITTLHNSSLMLDDIEDGSNLRRGLPAAHMVYGVPQTMNAANYLMTKAIKDAEKLSPAAVSVILERLLDAHIGQGMDLKWKHHTHIPTEDEYFAMVDGKTGGLFVLLADLMRIQATTNKDLDVTPLMKVVGRFFQTRDDYQNLVDAEYSDQKGPADDINEGKISLPVIYALQSPAYRTRLLSIFEQRKALVAQGGAMPLELRHLAVADITKAGGLRQTRDLVQQLDRDVQNLLVQAEKRAGVKNWVLRLIQRRLQID